MIKTATAFTMAMENGAKNSQAPNVTAAASSTPRVNHALTTSARRATGAREACACFTISIICRNTVPRPTFVASSRNAPERFMVPVKTLAPEALSTGKLSPVSMDSSTADAPSRTVPSTGMRSPGRTTATSPGPWLAQIRALAAA